MNEYTWQYRSKHGDRVITITALAMDIVEANATRSRIIENLGDDPGTARCLLVSVKNMTRVQSMEIKKG